MAARGQTGAVSRPENDKMTYDPEKHHRKSVRLREYDYSKPNAYFITICTYNKECIFGAIINGEMQLNAYGKIVENEWLKTPTIRPYVLLDKYIIMPNHIHGIIIIDGVAMCRDTVPVSSCATVEVAETRIPVSPRATEDVAQSRIPPFEQFCRDTVPVSPRATVEVAESRIPRIPTFEQFGRPTSHSIPTIIRSFKATTTKQIREIQKTHCQTVWQPRFYEHIIRNPHELDQTREYIIYNPLKWALDSENPDNKT